LDLRYTLTSERGIPKINLEQGVPLKQKRTAALPVIIGVAAIVFILDQISKFLIVQNIPLWGYWSISDKIARLFRFTFTTNTGAAFGMFPKFGTVFMIIAIVVVIGIVIFSHQLPVESTWVRVSLGLQLGGAMGNLVDRISRGFVVDFLDVGFWPIFNIADVAVVVGVCMLVYYFLEQENISGTAQDLTGLSRGKGL
jgi:signal peptidase II